MCFCYYFFVLILLITYSEHDVFCFSGLNIIICEKEWISFSRYGLSLLLVVFIIIVRRPGIMASKVYITLCP